VIGDVQVIPHMGSPSGCRRKSPATHSVSIVHNVLKLTTYGLLRATPCNLRGRQKHLQHIMA
jgi:hypothetical protein